MAAITARSIKTNIHAFKEEFIIICKTELTIILNN